VWIRNTEKEREYRYEEDSETLYGDTFVLRSNRRSETVKIPVANHVDDDWLELHIVAQNGEFIDVNYIDVMTYRRQPKTRVIQYTGYHEWEPWYNYTYTYFYVGPHYYLTDYGYYVRWSYPVYDRHYITIRRDYRRYLDRYRRRHGVVVHHYYRPVKDVTVKFYGRDRARTRRNLSKWTDRYETVRHEYSRSRYTKRQRDRTELQGIQTHVRQTIQKHRQEPTLVDREIQSRRVSLKRRRDRAQTDGSNRSTIRTQINTIGRKSDDSERSSIIKRTRTQPQETQKSRLRVIQRQTKTEPTQQRKTSVKRRQTQTESKKAAPSKTTSSDRQKRRESKDNEDDDDDEEEKNQKREARKKRR
jgi:hypothetical protein